MQSAKVFAPFLYNKENFSSLRYPYCERIINFVPCIMHGGVQWKK